MVDLQKGVGGGEEGGYYVVVFLFFSFVLLSFVLSCPLSLFLSDKSMVAVVVPVSLFFISFLK